MKYLDLTPLNRITSFCCFWLFCVLLLFLVAVFTVWIVWGS